MYLKVHISISKFPEVPKSTEGGLVPMLKFQQKKAVYWGFANFILHHLVKARQLNVEGDITDIVAWRHSQLQKVSCFQVENLKEMVITHLFHSIIFRCEMWYSPKYESQSLKYGPRLEHLKRPSSFQEAVSHSCTGKDFDDSQGQTFRHVCSWNMQRKKRYSIQGWCRRRPQSPNWTARRHPRCCSWPRMSQKSQFVERWY